MNRQQFLTSLIVLAALLVVMVGVCQAQAPEPQETVAAIGAAFTYQGHSNLVPGARPICSFGWGNSASWPCPIWKRVPMTLPT